MAPLDILKSGKQCENTLKEPPIVTKGRRNLTKTFMTKIKQTILITRTL